MNKITINIVSMYIVIFCLLSCSRVFNDNEDYNYNDAVLVLGNNTLLYTKIFQFNERGSYLWFDIRNEIANFSSPYLNHRFNKDLSNHYLKVDLRGRLYEYNSKEEELKILNYPLDIGLGKDMEADIVYGFKKKSTADCDSIVDKNKKRICEYTYILSFKRIIFKDIDFILEANIPNTYNGVVLTMQNMSEELYLTN